MEQKKLNFEVNIVFSEGRGKERTKMKHKHKTVITDKGKYLKLTFVLQKKKELTDSFLLKLLIDSRLLLMIKRRTFKWLLLIFLKIPFGT
jgi:hypothetical protein